ncbi:hypothetical protein ACP70R_005558 [Stipagrostis hirtigluma subsp. patula]
MASELSRRRASVMSQSQAIASRLDASAEAAETGTNGARRVEYDEEEPAAGRRRPRYDVFINHRGVDTKRNVARLLYDRLQQLAGGGVRSFLDSMSMRPGDRLNERIYEAIRECRVAVAIFSPRYFDSEFCLEELAAIVEARKIIIPIFYDIKPSELVLPPAVVDSKEHLPRDIERFRLALREVKYTVGLCHDSTTGDLADLVSAAANAVLERIEEMGSVQRRQMIVSRL